ncbi:MAG: hypothetical protein COB03_04145, partial [Alteromonas sp.]
ALVIDKWFNVQAQADREGVLDDVRSLLDHPDFNVANPNRVRSLVSAFCVNLAHFHDATGAGYAFLADRVLELNQKNPQLDSSYRTQITKGLRMAKKQLAPDLLMLPVAITD